MLQETASRVSDPDLFERPIIVGTAALADETTAQLSGAGIFPRRLILEPEGRNTGPAIAAAALACADDSLLLVMPSDHLIAEPDAFIAAVRAGLPLAEQGWLVTFGIRPEAPETGYGYIRRGEALAPGAFRAEAFVEKPDRVTAERYLSEGNYDWNAGIFLFRADAVIAALGAHAPDILEPVERSLAAASPEADRLRPEAGDFSQARAQSIDHAVMEKADRVAVVPVGMGWSDVGSWDALGDLGQPDSAGNVASGDAVLVDSRNCLVRSEGPVVVTIGAENLIVVATADAVLVVPRGQSQRVKEAVDLLKARKHPAAS